MSAKDIAAVQQLMDVLETRYAMRILWALRDGHPQTFRLLQDSVGGVTPNTMNTRLKELRAVNLMQHGTGGYQLTASGLDLMKRMSEVSTFAVKWSAALAKKK